MITPGTLLILLLFVVVGIGWLFDPVPLADDAATDKLDAIIARWLSGLRRPI